MLLGEQGAEDLVLNIPLAVPACRSGTLFSSTAVTGGITVGPARPTGTISRASAQVGAVGETTARRARPAAMSVRPPPITLR